MIHRLTLLLTLLTALFAYPSLTLADIPAFTFADVQAKDSAQRANNKIGRISNLFILR